MPDIQPDLFDLPDFAFDPADVVDHRAGLPYELPAGYYLDNFEYLLRFVRDTYPHLLSPSERATIDDFFCLNQDARKLFVRLSNRKGPYFRVDRLDYPELDMASAFESLVGKDLLRRVNPDSDEAAILCTREELLAVLPVECKGDRKQALIARCIQDEVNPLADNQIDVVEPQRQAELTVIKLLFFGNFRQDMTTFVLSELIAPYEQYALSGEAGPFPDRSVVDQLVFLQQISDISYEMIDTDSTGELLLGLMDLMPERPLEHVPGRRFDRVLNRVARQLERLGCLPEALALFERTNAPPSRERRARLLDKLGQPVEAKALCEEILASPLDDEESDFALKFGARISKKHDLGWRYDPPPANSAIPQSTISLDAIALKDSAANKQGLRVERLAADYFDQQGHQSWYVENLLFRSLFGLAFWDIIFAPVSGAFFNPFQRAPMDIHTADFYNNRQALIESRLGDIRRGSLPALVAEVYRAKRGIANQFVNWTALDESLVASALQQVPAEHFHAIFSRLVRDIKDNTSGFPDLILFSDNGYKLVEVKGPGDKLQKNQTRWFHYFLAHDMPAEVVNVELIS